MARIRTFGISGPMLYALLWDDTGKVWNGSAFATYSTANRIAGGLAATFSAGTFDCGNQPSGSEAATTVVFYIQAGQTRADTDQPVDAQSIGSVSLDVSTLETSLAAIKAKTDLLGSGTVTVRSSFLTDGTRLMLTRGDTYKQASGTALRWSFAAGIARDMTTARAVRFSARNKNTDDIVIDSVSMIVVQSGSGTQILDLELTLAQTENLPVGPESCYYDIEADYGNLDYTTILREGRLTVRRDETRH